jgi:hypothetical protein
MSLNPTQRVNWIATTVLLLSLAGGVATIRAVDRRAQNPVNREVLYLSSPKVLRRMSLGYTGLLADIYWTRSVQYFGRQHQSDSGDFPLLAPLLQITTELDPKLLPAYEFGANFLAPKPPGGAGSPDEALALMKFGVEHNPDQWRLYYDLGFLYYTEFKDYAAAADAFGRGAKLPIRNDFMPILAARMAQHAGEFDTARMLWLTTYQSTKEGQIRQNAVEHLVALQVDEEVTRLDFVVQRYRDQNGKLPYSMVELVRTGFLAGMPIDPKGHAYKLMADGRIEVQNPENIFFITKGLPPGVDPPQPPRPLKLNSK